MARGVNKVILIGNLGDEPLCRATHSGCSVTNISMVTNEVRRNIDTGETTEYAEWHRVVMWGKLADIAKQYLHKGSQIYVEGKLRTRSFLDKQGQKRSVTEIVADEMQMLGARPMTSGPNAMMGTQRLRPNGTIQPNFNQGMGMGQGMGNSIYNNQPSLTQPQGGYNTMGPMGGYGAPQSNLGNYGNQAPLSNIYGNGMGNNDMSNDMDGNMMSGAQDDMDGNMMQDGNTSSPNIASTQAPSLNNTENKNENAEPSLNDEIPF